MKNQKPRSSEAKPLVRPELLAPAGSPETWVAAVEAGADSVYLGQKDFSARAFAANFSPAELEHVVHMSHERGVKVFVAFNSLLKEEELPRAARNLEALTRIGPDALIVQDLGLMNLIRKHFPQFEVHASTLLAVHNQPGIETLDSLGFKRAVLARELTLKEVDRLTENSPLGLEIFIHGALCFSFSGLCLMSGFLGGKGSLRGACTQPCRRRYLSGKKSGFFFSPADLDASSLMERIRTMPLSALKIEGRMKGAAHVSLVVGAYRLLLDAPAEDLPRAMAEAEKMIEASLGRKRSTGFLLSPNPVDVLTPHQAGASGTFLGRIKESGPKGALVQLQDGLAVGDRLRVLHRKNDEQTAFTLKKIILENRETSSAESGSNVFLEAPGQAAVGDLLFKVDEKSGQKQVKGSPLLAGLKAGPQKTGRQKTGRPKTGRKPARDDRSGPALKKALTWLNPPPVKTGGPSGRPEVWYRLARAEDISGLSKIKPDRVILPLTTPNLKRFGSLRKRLGKLADRLIWAPPPLVFNPNPPARDIRQALSLGARGFFVSNLGQIPLLKNVRKSGRFKPALFGDYRLNSLNSKTEEILASLGLEGATLCLETDEQNLNQVLARPAALSRLIYLFGRPPLFTSRLTPPGLKENQPVESPRRERFRVRIQSGQFMAMAERPIFFTGLLRQRSLPGVKAFIVDLEFDPRPLAAAEEISEAIKRGRPYKKASRFNFDRGLY